MWSDGTTMRVADWLDEKIYACRHWRPRPRVQPARNFDTLKAAGNQLAVWHLIPAGQPCWWQTSLTKSFTPTILATKAREPGQDLTTLRYRCGVCTGQPLVQPGDELGGGLARRQDLLLLDAAGAVCRRPELPWLPSTTPPEILATWWDNTS